MDEIKGIRIVSLTGEKEYGIEDSEARQDVQQIVEGAPEAFDTFKEIAEYIAEDGATAAEIIKNVAANAQGIADEITRAKAAEEAIKNKAVEADSLNVAQEIDEVRIDFDTLDDGAHSGEIIIPAATTESAGVMSAADKVKLDSLSQGGGGDVTTEQLNEVKSRIETIENTPFVTADEPDGEVEDIPGFVTMPEVESVVAEAIANAVTNVINTPV